MIIRPAVFDRYILALDIADFGQAPTEGGSHRRIRPGRRAIEKSDYRHRRLLRLRPERPCHCAAEKRHKPPAFHSMTSSASASSLSGTWKPVAFAVLRLITNSYLVGART